MTKELSNIDGNLAIDGNMLKLKYSTREEIIITGKNLHLKNKSGFVFNNIILQLSGNIIIDDEATVYPKIIDSYIFCKSSDNIESKRIIQDSKFKDIVELSKVKYLKKIKGNPKIYIFNSAGKCEFKGYKNEIEGNYLTVARYDVKVDGKQKSFKSKILFY